MSEYKKKNGAIYVCHTYYHVYVTFLKELNRPKEDQGRATLVLSKMSTNFGDFPERVRKCGFFKEVLEYNEKRQSAYPELDPYMAEGGNIVGNMLRRIQMTKKFGRLCAQEIPADFTQYEDVYVFCDIDPIGYYLNWKHIPYHAVEDGLNTLKYIDGARYENRGFFKLKAFMSSKLNLIFVQNGYGKYCIDMEVNDISVIEAPCKKYVEVSRQALADHLTTEGRDIILRAFVRNIDALKSQIQKSVGIEKILILTEPLCDLQTRERIFRDLIEEYQAEGQIYIKPHPRDELDYRTLFAEYEQFDGEIPMEVLNLFPDFRVKKVISVLTEVKAIQFADETVMLGPAFLDRYEDPAKHAQVRRLN